ncbi:aldehyde dehydrogenase family protein [Vibrio lentus]|nr:aldehyde dehydrogenase family protein [Vibrio lentus]
MPRAGRLLSNGAGGKDPMIVTMRDCLFPRTGRSLCRRGRFETQGKCVLRLNVFYVDDRIAEEFEQRVWDRQHVLDWPVGYAGRQYRTNHQRDLQHSKDCRPAKDAQRRSHFSFERKGGSEPARALYPPYGYHRNDVEMKLETEETFGPVIVALSVVTQTLTTVIERANDSSMGWVPWCSETKASMTLLTNLMLAWLALIKDKAAVVMLHGWVRNRVALVTTARLTDTVSAQVKVVSR